MCGISGFILIKKSIKNPRRILKEMTNSVSHRGPDSVGYWNDDSDNIFLGHRRLSIVDLSRKGTQPMQSYCGRYVISFNGEIYNYQELRKELFKKFKVNFDNTTDTQVVLELISKLGIKKSLTFLEGMFAFAVWDKSTKKLTLVRDRFGEKPLFYFKDSIQIVFGSELKVLKSYFKSSLSISQNGSFYYSMLGYIPAPWTIYENIYKVMPSQFIEFNINTNKTIKSQYYSVGEGFSENNTDILSSKRLIMNSLESSIKKMMVADVEVGSFLSGGIDSSIVSILMQKNSLKKIKTFTVGFDESAYDESNYAKKIAKLIGSDHHEIRVKVDDMIENIDDVVKIFDEPFSDSSFIPTFLISKLAGSKVKVVLSGDGGDEIFMGYNRYLIAKKINLIQKLLPNFFTKSFSSLINFIPSIVYDKLSEPFQKILGLHGLSHKMKKLSNILNYEKNCDFYLKLNLIDNEISKSRREIVKKDFSNYNNFPLIDSLQRNDIDFYLPNDILVKVDRSSMANSLEVRSPFLNHNVVNSAFKLSSNLKLYKNTLKYLLKDILSDFISKEIVNRPKMGFAIPIEKWINNKVFTKKVDSIFYESDWKLLGYNKLYLIKKWDNFKKYKSTTPQDIWMYFMAGIWLNKLKD